MKRLILVPVIDPAMHAYLCMFMRSVWPKITSSLHVQPPISCWKPISVAGLMGPHVAFLSGGHEPALKTLQVGTVSFRNVVQKEPRSENVICNLNRRNADCQQGCLCCIRCNRCEHGARTTQQKRHQKQESSIARDSSQLPASVLVSKLQRGTPAHSCARLHGLREIRCSR